MYSMAVWDNSGTQYLPIMGYDGIIMCYMSARSALTVVASEFDIDFCIFP